MQFPPMVYVNKYGETDRVVMPSGEVLVASEVSRKKFRKALSSLVGQETLVFFASGVSLN